MYNVLYVDDDPDLLDLCKIFLDKKWGISVNTTISADDALHKLKEETFDAIISDYEMPHVDGITLLKKVRTEKYTLPYILFTGKGREEVVIDALNNGADFYLQKGGNPMAQFSELVNMIKKSVDKTRTEKERDKANSISRSFINHLPDPTFAVDNYCNIISWNSALEDMTGIKSEYVIGKNAEEIFKNIYECDLPFLGSAIVNNKSDNQNPDKNNKYYKNVISVEIKINDRYGRLQTLWAKASPIFDNNDQICGAIETFRDISSLREKELEIRETSKKLQSIIDFIPDPTFVIDNRGIVISWNHALEELTGINSSNIIGNGDYIYSLAFYSERSPVLIDLILNDTHEIKKRYKTVIQNKNSIKVESYIPELNGKKEVYLWGIAAPLYDTEGNFIGAIESIRDISDIKKLELELKQKYEELATSFEEIAAQNEEIKASFEESLIRENLLTKSEQKFRSLIENMNYGIIIHSDGVIDYVNPVAADILGYENPNELIGLHTKDIIDPSQKSTLVEKLEDDLPPHNKFVEGLLAKKDGTQFPAEIARISVVLDDSRSVMTMIRDITNESEQKCLLNQTKKKLDTLSQITRHDIRNELQIITNIIDILSDLNPSDPTRNLIERAKISGQKILNDLKISAEYQLLGVKDPDWFNIRDLFYKAAAWHQISDKIEYENGAIEIFADPLINKVFENLIENSLRHGGNINKITLKTISFSNELLLFYKDDGIGIPEDEKNRIFLEGYGKHSGLGLYLIKEILSVTDISIIENGKYREGALFEIRIPKGRWRNIEES